MTRRCKTRHSVLCAAVRRLLLYWGCTVVPVKQTPTPCVRRDGSVGFRRGALLPGAADMLACSPTGRFLAVEVKCGKDRLRPAQRLFLADVKKRGGLALVVTDTVEELQAHKREICGDAEVAR